MPAMRETGERKFMTLEELEQMRTDEAKIEFVDGILRGYSYQHRIADHEAEELARATAILNGGGVRSITYKDPEIAACKRGTRDSAGPDIIGMIDDCDKHRARMERAMSYCRRVDEWRESLPDEERALIEWRYDEAMSLYQIADRMYVSRNTARARLNDTLLTFPDN